MFPAEKLALFVIRSIFSKDYTRTKYNRCSEESEHINFLLVHVIMKCHVELGNNESLNFGGSNCYGLKVEKVLE